MNNEELVKKAVIAATALASGGKLNDKQSNLFIDYVFDTSVLQQFARVVRFRNANLDIDKIGVGKRLAVAAKEGVDPGVRRGVHTSQIKLTPQEVMLPNEITDTFKEHNIEGDDITEHVLRMFARGLRNDLEELYINGNEGGILQTESFLLDGGSDSLYQEDAYLKLFDGLLQQAGTSHIVDHSNQVLSTSMFRAALSQMPYKFKRNKKALKWLSPVEIDEMWRERLSSRATAMGDAALNSEVNLTPFGIELIPVPHMPMYPQQVKTVAFTGSGTTVSLDHAPIKSGSVVVMKETDAASKQPREPYVEGTDYTVDEAAGTVTHIASGSGGNIGNTEEVRITYQSMPQLVLTVDNNIIIAIGRDITMERDRAIFRRVDQFATTVKVDTKFEETDAVVLVKNISDDL